MKNMLLALLCAVPLVGGYAAYEEPQPAAQAGTVYLTSMGCDLRDCEDPAHYHYCVSGCIEAGHYHDCPVGCADPLHPHCGVDREPAAAAQVEFCPSMGCDLRDCEDPAHYHYCVSGCIEAGHYHDCPVGCADPLHPHCGVDREPAAAAQVEFCPSMGCEDPECADPSHYHYCAAGCTAAAHYHNCPLEEQDTTRPYYYNGGHHQERRGRHGCHRR